MARTHKKVSYSPTGKLEDVTPDMAASGIEGAFRILEGRWKMVIVFHLFARGILRFSELEKAIPAASPKMLTQQLRELERDGVVSRTVYPQVPPKVEYSLTPLGRELGPLLDSMSDWGRRVSVGRSASSGRVRPAPAPAAVRSDRGAGARPTSRPASPARSR
jgi:DNA-binding HxlR family transcriptional regulator